MASTDTDQLRNGTPPDAGGHKRKSRRRDGATGSGVGTTSDAGGSSVVPSSPGRPSRTPRSGRPVTVGARRSARRIAGLAEVSESLDTRRRLRRLGRQVEGGPRNVQEIAFLENALGECLDEAANANVQRERWLLCEAATWGLAWLARTRRAGGSAGGLLERIATAARAAGPTLAAGDTLPARFVLTLARLFADIEACRCLEAAAVSALEAEICRLVGSEGGVRLSGSAAMLERIVRWSAAREVGEATGSLPWDKETDVRFGLAVAFGLRLLGRQGRLLAGAGRLPAAFSDPLLSAAAESRSRRVRRSAEAVQRSGGGSRAGKRERDATRKMLARDVHDPLGVAVLRSGWEPDPIRVIVQYAQAVPHLEIAVGDRLLVDGPWRLQVGTGARPLSIEGPWTPSCWESDRRATFLEITAPLSGGLQVDRQIVLLPRDRVVLLSDAVTQRPAEAHRHGDAPVASLRLESVLPLAASLEGEQAEETREVFVCDTKPRFMALPLSLPEWKAAGRGRFEVAADGLVLEHEAAATRCCAPLWLDLDPTRQGRPLTWRQLTVADTRRNLPPQQAIGFRIQEGLEQWLVYRTLDEPRNRTVLGCNVSCDFLVGRIGRNGAVERTIEIQ